jgi:hypothetical protein
MADDGAGSDQKENAGGRSKKRRIMSALAEKSGFEMALEMEVVGEKWRNLGKEIDESCKRFWTIKSAGCEKDTEEWGKRELLGGRITESVGRNRESKKESFDCATCGFSADR